MPYHNSSNGMNEMEQMISEIECLRVRISGSSELNKSQIERTNSLLSIIHGDLIRWNDNVQQSTDLPSVDTIKSGYSIEGEDTLRHSDEYYHYFRNR